MPSFSSESSALSVPSSSSLKLRIQDVVASFLLAALIVIGAVVALLFAVWLQRDPTYATSSFPLEFRSKSSSGAQLAAEHERTILPLSVEVFEELEEPALEQELSQISETAKLVAAQLEVSNTINPGTAGATGKRLADPVVDADGEQYGNPYGIPVRSVWERWELKFRAADIRYYAKQLDYFEIELGCVGGGIATVDSVSDFSSGGKKTSQSPSEANESDNLIFAWRDKNKLAEYDQELLSQAEIKTEGRTLLRFIPAKLESQLAKLEMEHCRREQQSLDQVFKTVFECKPRGKGFEWTVVDQLCRK